MRLVRFSQQDSSAIGVLEEDVVINVAEAGEALGIDVPAETRALLGSPKWREKLELAADYAAETGLGRRDRDEVTLEPPIAEPQKVVCVGLNYVEHIEEGGEDRPENPVLFSKYPTSVVGPGDAIAWDPALTAEVDYEVELATVIGEESRRIDESNALDAVAGYTVANDVSARDLQFADDQWVRGKSLDTFCPLGPSIVTADEIDPHDLDLWTDLNGERLQESNTGNLIFGIDEIVAFCSRAFTLKPGDVILTGTPPGVGIFRDPPVLLEDGDEVTVGVEGIGDLTNTCSTV